MSNSLVQSISNKRRKREIFKVLILIYLIEEKTIQIQTIAKKQTQLARYTKVVYAKIRRRL